MKNLFSHQRAALNHHSFFVVCHACRRKGPVRVVPRELPFPAIISKSCFLLEAEKGRKEDESFAFSQAETLVSILDVDAIISRHSHSRLCGVGSAAGASSDEY